MIKHSQAGWIKMLLKQGKTANQINGILLENNIISKPISNNSISAIRQGKTHADVIPFDEYQEAVVDEAGMWLKFIDHIKQQESISDVVSEVVQMSELEFATPGKIELSLEIKMHLLINFSDNYADEFDLDGWFVTTKEVWEKFKQQEIPEEQWHSCSPYRHSSGKCFEIYFGTNESIQYGSLEDYFSNFRLREISEQDYETLVRLFRAVLLEEEYNGEKYFSLNSSGTVLNAFDY